MYYTETCPVCWGVGAVKNRSYWTLTIEKIPCRKCKGRGVMHYKTSPERRKKGLEKYYTKKRVTIPVRWTPPEKIPEEYEL